MSSQKNLDVAIECELTPGSINGRVADLEQVAQTFAVDAQGGELLNAHEIVVAVEQTQQGVIGSSLAVAPQAVALGDE